MIKWTARLLGYCGHEYQWQESEWVNVKGYEKLIQIQQGICKRCGVKTARKVYIRNPE